MPNDLVMISYVLARSAADHIAERIAGRMEARFISDERGEGVISAAIAVLIMAFLGAAMWIIFRQILDDSGSRTNSTINNIGAE